MLAKKGKKNQQCTERKQNMCTKWKKNSKANNPRKEPKKMKDDKLTKFREEELKFTIPRFAHKIGVGGLLM
jgi:hypothetical protein